MKLPLLVGLLSLTFSALAQRNDVDTQIKLRAESLYKKIVEQDRHLRLDHKEKQILLQNLKESVKMINLESRPGGQGGGNYPEYPTPIPLPQNLNMVSLYADNSCFNKISDITPYDNCEMLNNVFQNRITSSVKVNERCYDITNNSFLNACNSLQPLALEPIISNQVVETYADNSCFNLITNLDPQVNYQTWMPVFENRVISSVKVENKCIDIINESFSAERANTFIDAALNMRRPIAGYERIEMFSDNSCFNGVTGVQRGDDCSKLDTFYGHYNVSSIHFRGKCEDIINVKFKNACDTFGR